MTKARKVEETTEIVRNGIVIAAKAMKPGKAAGPSVVCAKMISASRDVKISEMMELR